MNVSTETAANASAQHGLLRRVIHARSVRQAFFVFALTRFIMFVICVLTINFTFVEMPGVKPLREPLVSLYKKSIARDLRTDVGIADAQWYMMIATGGYEERPFAANEQHNWAFFPLYPLLLRLASKLTGGHELTAVALSSICFFLALVLLHKTACEFGCGNRIADRALLYISIFPTSYFFSLPMPEALFLLLSVSSFYFARRERWWLAGVAGALASATRLTGILLLPILLLLYFEQQRRRTSSFVLRANILGLFLIPAGLFAFMFYLRLITGNAFAFADIQAAWGRRAGLFLVPLYEFIIHPGVLVGPWDFKLMNFAVAIMSLLCGGALIKRREWALGLYVLLSVVIPLSSLTLQSFSRYALVVFPIFIVLASIGEEHPRLDEIIRTVFAVLFGLMTMLFAAHFTLALA